MSWTRMAFVFSWILLILSGQSAANNLHDKLLRSAVAPLVAEGVRKDEPAKSKARLQLSLTDSKDLPAQISYRILPLESKVAKSRTQLQPGLHELVVFEAGRETFRKKFIAFADLQSDLRLHYSKEVGFSLVQTIELPQLKFAKSKKAIMKESQAILEYLAALMQDEPNIGSLAVHVHTDSGGREASNIRLTQARADEVTAFLRKKGVDPKRLLALGLGSSRPLVPNTSKENRLLNRRVEFVVDSVQDKLLLGTAR